MADYVGTLPNGYTHKHIRKGRLPKSHQTMYKRSVTHQSSVSIYRFQIVKSDVAVSNICFCAAVRIIHL
eukprot:scaffold13641_cov42-Cyclotella_meneghiniana.AAC.8